jgi:hypothetical protein
METRSEIDGWKQALSGAEVLPSASVWEGVETQLDKGEVKKLRRTVLLYKMLAAACVSIMVLAFGVDYYTESFQDKAKQQSASSATRQPEDLMKGEQESKATLSSDQQPGSSSAHYHSNTAVVVNSTDGAAEEYVAPKNSKHLLLSMNTILASLSATNSFGAGNERATQNGSNGEFTTVKSPLMKEETKKQSTVFDSGTDDAVKKKDEDKKGAEKFWTSIGVAAGAFNNATPTSAGAPANALSSFSAGQTAASETNSSGYSYSVNVAVGAKVSNRWLIQGGMSYMAQLSDYTATTVVAQPTSTTPVLSAASINQFEKQTDKATIDILTSTPYSVNSEIQWISFPIQAGYMLVDRKLALQLNSGISTDLFMQNTITPKVENLESTTQGRGDDSPYRPVNFSGLVGTEVSYRFSDHYRVSLSPGIRYPFNSIYKSDLGIKSSPLTFDVALRFRYILK